MSQTIVDVFQIGARMHYAIPKILDGEGKLGAFYTDATLNSKIIRAANSLPAILKGEGLLKRVTNRDVGLSHPDKIIEFPIFGIAFALRKTLFRGTHNALTTKRWGVQKFGELCKKKWGRNCDAIYVFNLGGLEVLAEARASGIRTIYEQMIAPRRVFENVMQAERSKWANWETVRHCDSDYFIERERKEWSLSDAIICPSRYVKKHLISEGVDANKVHLVPYGFTSNQVHQPSDHKSNNNGKLRILFAGQLGLRKGIQYLYQAAKKIKSRAIEFHALGKPMLEKNALSMISSEMQVHGAVPADEVLNEMQNADIFVLPSLCEGSATVIYEALSHGLPVITTENSGSVVRHGHEGLIVEAGNADELADAIIRLADDSDLRQSMRNAAYSRAKEFTLSEYGKRLLKVIDQVV